jgi:hypothetical protein
MTTRVKDPGQAAGSPCPPYWGRPPKVLMNMKTRFCTLERAIDYAVSRGLNPQHWRIVTGANPPRDHPLVADFINTIGQTEKNSA